MRAGSLKLRLFAAAAISISLALFLAGLTLGMLFENEVRDRVMRELNNHLLQLVGLLEADASGIVGLQGQMADPRFEKPESGLYWQVTVAEPPQTLLSRSLWDTPIERAAGPKSSASGQATGSDGEPLLYFSRRITLDAGGKPLGIEVMTAIAEQEVTLAAGSFRQALAMSLSALALALIIAAWLQVQVGLRPLSLLRDGLAAVRSGAAKRLTGDFPDEVAPLVGEFNGVIEAQAQSLERARARAGDLAHGLKTPLTVLSAIARDIAKAGLTAEAAEIAEQADAMRRHTDQELIRARLATGKAVASARLDESVRRLVSAMKRSPRGEEMTWTVEIAPLTAVPLDGQDLTELLGNLIDNARKWAKSEVRVSFAGRALTISDDGAGVPEADLGRIAERGTRLDEKVQGSGLGLSIVRDIAELYKLKLDYGRSSLGGFAVTVTFP